MKKYTFTVLLDLDVEIGNEKIDLELIKKTILKDVPFFDTIVFGTHDFSIKTKPETYAIIDMKEKIYDN